MGEVGISVLLDGNLIQASGIARFTFIPTGKEYLLYTLNEKTVQDGVELNKLYVSETGEGDAQLSIIGQDDWVSIKSIMAELSKPNATIPNNIQLGVLSARQYNVGPYKKIAVKDEMKNGIISAQLTHQPNENTEVTQTTSSNQFIQTTPEEVSAVPVQTVPSAFEMTAPAPEQTAPITLVSDPTPAAPVQPQEVVQPVVQPQPVVQTVQPVQQVVVPTQVTVPTQPVVDINSSVKEIINHCNNDANKVIELFRNNGLELNVAPPSGGGTQLVQPVQPVVSEPTVPVQVETTATPINISDLPVATQPVAVPTDELSEESIVPTTPTLPVENTTTIIEQPTTLVQPTVPTQPVVSEPTVSVQPQTTEIVQTSVVSQPTIPVQQVIPVQNTIVEQPTTLVQPTVPTQPVVSEPTVPVQTTVNQVVEQPITQNVVNEVVTVPTSMPAQSETAIITQDMQNSTVSFDIPEEPAQPVVADNITGVPTILPLTPEDLQPPTPVGTQTVETQSVPTQTVQPAAPSGEQLTSVSSQPLPAEANKAFIDTAGPVVKPIGQEQTTATGTPGDSGQV